MLNKQKLKHNFHLVDMSPWPIVTSFTLLILMTGLVMVLHSYTGGSMVSIIGVAGLVYCLWSWWRDVIHEGRVGKHHTSEVQNGLRIGMALFIFTEVMFFFVFFWSLCWFMFFPAGILESYWVVAEGMWPPEGIKTFDPWDIPFLNTLILLLSGTTVTWAHHAILQHDKKNAVLALGLTVLLGSSFTALQMYEYHHAAFSISDGIYGANFYMATGFHGIHVVIGTIFLIVCFARARKGHFSKDHGHLSFEFAAWYWHFVDVVWLFLFLFLYVIGR